MPMALAVLVFLALGNLILLGLLIRRTASGGAIELAYVEGVTPSDDLRHGADSN
jgi:hypothetical protein